MSVEPVHLSLRHQQGLDTLGIAAVWSTWDKNNSSSSKAARIEGQLLKIPNSHPTVRDPLLRIVSLLAFRIFPHKSHISSAVSLLPSIATRSRTYVWIAVLYRWAASWFARLRRCWTGVVPREHTNMFNIAELVSYAELTQPFPMAVNSSVAPWRVSHHVSPYDIQGVSTQPHLWASSNFKPAQLKLRVPVATNVLSLHKVHAALKIPCDCSWRWRCVDSKIFATRGAVAPEQIRIGKRQSTGVQETLYEQDRKKSGIKRVPVY